jgi:hypothetical protein
VTVTTRDEDRVETDTWKCDEYGCSATVSVAVGERIPLDWFVVHVWERGPRRPRYALSYCPRHGNLVRGDYTRALNRRFPS